MTSFDTLPLTAKTRQALKDHGYLAPTPVQQAVFEAAGSGRDVVVQARTGTGKTLAFGLPIVEKRISSDETVQVLILTPTRELAIQVAGELRKIAGGAQVSAIYGGAPVEPQIAELAKSPRIVCGTPGRVLDHLRRGTLTPSAIRTFVLDEADEMLSMGFARELSSIISFLPNERQGLFFSATLPPDIERLAKEKLREPSFITLSSDQVGALTIDHFAYHVMSDKASALLRVLEVENPESAVVPNAYAKRSRAQALPQVGSMAISNNASANE
jgi:ATP-dependent RNA helicase DeaD